jgi:hypothetical protein
MGVWMVKCGVGDTPNKKDVTHTTTPARTPITSQYNKAVVVANGSQDGEAEGKLAGDIYAVEISNSGSI